LLKLKALQQVSSDYFGLAAVGSDHFTVLPDADGTSLTLRIAEC